MRRWSAPPLLLAALLSALMGMASASAAADPGGAFLQAYTAYQDGVRLEADGKLDDSLQKYRYCASVLEQLEKANPTFEPIVVDYRLKKARESIGRVTSLKQGAPPPVTDLSPPSAPAPPAATPPPRPAPSALSLLSTDYRIPTPGVPTPAMPPTVPAAPPSVAVAPADDVIGRGAAEALRIQIQALKNELNQERQAKDDLSRRLLESQAREQSALTEVDRTKVRVVELQAQIAQLQQTLGDLEQTNTKLAKEKEADRKQIADLQASVEAAQADLEVADEYNGELFSKLEQAAKFIDSSEKIRAQLLAERKVLAGRSSAKLVKERDEAQAREKELLAKLDAAQKVTQENKDLSAKLAKAEDQIAVLSKNKAEREKIETDLKSGLEAANKATASLRDELKAGQQRITELEKQLADTAKTAASTTGAIAEENAVLKKVVERQLEEQARRQQLRKLIEEEMEKLQVRSTTLLDKLDAMAGEEAPLTPQERKLVEHQPAATGAARTDFELVIRKNSPDSDLPAELVPQAKKANELAQNQQFAEARTLYEEIAQKAPESYFAAVNLGIAQRQLGNYPQAIAAFRRALEIKPGDAYALMNLGNAQYRSGDAKAAVETLQQAVSADAQSYFAHYLLGVALNEQGDRAGAEKEVGRSLDLKPDYLPAVQLKNDIEEEADTDPKVGSSKAP